MKSPAMKVPALAALLLALAPLAAFAQNIASQPGSMNRNLDRLTLLPGPYLLSPARGAALPAPAIKIDTTLFRFEPSTSAVKSASGKTSLFLRGTGTLTLSGNNGQTSPRLRTDRPPPLLESLRFESILPTTPVALPLDGKAALKRD